MLGYSKPKTNLVVKSGVAKFISNKFIASKIAPHHRRMGSGGSYSNIQNDKNIKRGYINLLSSNLRKSSKLSNGKATKNPTSKLEAKHKSGYTFGDLSTISTMISKTFQNN